MSALARIVSRESAADVTSIIDELILRAANAWIFITRGRLRRRCIRHFGRFPDIARPCGHDALMQWRKVFDHNPLFVTFCDKLETREWVRRRMPELKCAELVWVGTSVDDLPLDLLTADVVLKAASGSGWNYFPGRQHWDVATVRDRCARWLQRPRRRDEWAYGQLPARILIERLNGTVDELVDLNLRCHNGRVASAFIGYAWKTDDARGAYVSADGTPLSDAGQAILEQVGRPVPPELFQRASSIAAHLSAGIDHVRVDFHLRGDEIFLGELTVYSSSGLGEEEKEGVGPIIERQWIEELDESWFLSTPQPWPVSLYQGAFRRWLERRRAELGVS
ncbi:ATP-grasp fold amidoligase family protein [Devosia sp. ZB163]|uniref:ATP-grasp fold amidoligase family protein n=1 Tax=Devosia sp. ZB163 TaxID=3025938 RepID=UPI00235E67E7|nr:ATP-grasp fold amidoligase family protein [Devosia sp. ZB163]MDC9823134.1 ATP-grasp fold amidoligase family protein [Devosia sp. ZB163]